MPRGAEHAAATDSNVKSPTPQQYCLEKMNFGKGKDKSVIHYNDFITVWDIPRPPTTT